jgi:hypothetical protein
VADVDPKVSEKQNKSNEMYRLWNLSFLFPEGLQEELSSTDKENYLPPSASRSFYLSW